VKLIKKIIYGILIVLVLITILFGYSQVKTSTSSANSTKTINVLIYDGTGTMGSSVNGIEDCLNEINNQSSNKKFNYTTTVEINSETLQGYDVLIIPGGDASEYIENSEIDNSSIKQFVSSGKGYLGICAGAYAATNYVDGYYSGWGLEPDVTAENVNYEGNLTISTTSFGKHLTSSSDITIYHQNGPALYTNNTDHILSTYADNNTGYEGYADMVGEDYGSGRVILSGSHPEHEPENLELLKNMLLWLTKNLN
jgi:glutamine amidotransferase-like uncharacterized protein